MLAGAVFAGAAQSGWPAAAVGSLADVGAVLAEASPHTQMASGHTFSPGARGSRAHVATHLGPGVGLGLGLGPGFGFGLGLGLGLGLGFGFGLGLGLGLGFGLGLGLGLG